MALWVVVLLLRACASVCMNETPPWSAQKPGDGTLQRTGMGGVRVSAGEALGMYVCMYLFATNLFTCPLPACYNPDFQMSEHDGGEQEREE